MKYRNTKLLRHANRHQSDTRWHQSKKKKKRKMCFLLLIRSNRNNMYLETHYACYNAFNIISDFFFLTHKTLCLSVRLCHWASGSHIILKDTISEWATNLMNKEMSWLLWQRFVCFTISSLWISLSLLYNLPYRL